MRMSKQIESFKIIPKTSTPTNTLPSILFLLYFILQLRNKIDKIERQSF